MTGITYKVTDFEAGLEARVVQLDTKSYSVTLWDLDAKEVLPTVKIFPEGRLEAAKKYAESLNG